MNKINRIVFLGTPDFAVPSLQALVENGYPVVAVFTQPDRPKGRGNKVVFSPVKEYALAHNIPVFQPDKIRRPENARILKQLQPDLMVTAAFGQILSKENLDTPTYGCINVHGSLLPAYRGSSPIQWAVINGEKETGITTMFTDVGIDNGDILLQKKTAIGDCETAGELFDRLASLGAETLLETLHALEEGKLARIPQDESKASHYPMLDKDSAGIDFFKSAKEIVNLVRGMNPWPVAWTKAGEDVIKVYAASVFSDKKTAEPGTILNKDHKNGLVVACGDGAVSLDVIQFPGKKAMDAKTFFVGNQIKTEVLSHE